LVLDQGYSLISYSESINSYFDIDFSESIGETIWDIIPDLKKGLYSPESKFLGNGRSVLQNKIFDSFSNKWFDAKIVNLGDIVLVLLDEVSALVYFEDKLKDNEKILASILKNLFDGVIVLNTKGEVILLNEAAEKITGFRTQELLGKNINILLPFETRAIHDGYLAGPSVEEAMNKINHRRDLKIRSKNGVSIPIELAISQTAIEQGDIFICSINDITDRLQQEERIRELARFPEETWNVVMKIEQDGLLSYSNSRSEYLLEYWNTEVGHAVPGEVLKIVQRTIAQGRSESIEFDCGALVYSVLFAPSLETKSVYVYGTDVTLNKLNEKELLRHREMLEEMIEERTRELAISKDQALAANRAKSVFLANMSHEMRTPLAAIIGYAESLMDEYLNKEEKDRAIDTIIRSSSHLKAIINDVLDISKIEADKLELESIKTDLSDLITDVVTVNQPIAGKKGLEIEVNYLTPVPSHIHTDPTRLKQILMNLCSNAIKFTEKGSIAIKVKYEEDRRLNFDVVDTGIGIKRENLRKIFSKFSQADSATTRRYGGTGLGLTLSRELALMFGGNLTVESEYGKGSCFTLFVFVDQLPEDAKLISQFIRTKVNEEEHKQHKPLFGRVLIVEDTPDIQELVKFVLRKAGIKSDVAENGKEGVELALSRDYDLVLMDLQMPTMDGLQATRLLREKNYDKPIIALTANVTKQDQEQCLEAGFTDFTVKPIKKAHFFEILEKYMSNTKETKPIYSQLLEDDPELIELVTKFVTGLPEFIEAINKAMENGDVEEVSKTAHKLKGIGGGYGYPMLTTLAAEIQAVITSQDLEKLAAKVGLLNEMAEGISLGMSPQSKAG
ncbi:MAG: ATP-binding protein, partial [Gammaproteobacteria bacterium]|nr:ATP-binding protein [Gammaproteobacteria bacterium]